MRQVARLLHFRKSWLLTASPARPDQTWASQIGHPRVVQCSRLFPNRTGRSKRAPTRRRHDARQDYQASGRCDETRAQDFHVWDQTLPGFGLKVTPKGKKVYVVQYRMVGRGFTLRRYTIGPHGAYTPEEARENARKVRQTVRELDRSHDAAQKAGAPQYR